MNESMMESGSTLAGGMDVLFPLFVAEVVSLCLFYGAYFLAVHTAVLKSDDMAERLFFAFRRVRKFVGVGLGVSFALFNVSLFLAGAASIALRDTSLTLFLLTGWGGIVWAGWECFRRNVKIGS